MTRGPTPRPSSPWPRVIGRACALLRSEPSPDLGDPGDPSTLLRPACCYCPRAALRVQRHGAPGAQGPAPRLTPDSLQPMVLGVSCPQSETEPGQPTPQPLLLKWPEVHVLLTWDQVARARKRFQKRTLKIQSFKSD